jgi:hypothetical protein
MFKNRACSELVAKNNATASLVHLFLPDAEEIFVAHTLRIRSAQQSMLPPRPQKDGEPSTRHHPVVI